MRCKTRFQWATCLERLDERVHGNAGGPHACAKRDDFGGLGGCLEHIHLALTHARHSAVQHQLDAAPATRQVVADC